MNSYTKALQALNKEQRKAVEAIDGPLLVVAGPGTGKTQLLSTRVAYILKNTDARAGNILCLTFTNKAAVNMKERIVSLTGAAGAKVNTKTFHSFAAEIMNIYPDYFWNAAQLSVAPDTVQLDIIESIVDKLPLDNPLSLKFAGQYTLLNDIQQAINLAKDAGLTPEKLRAIINGNLAYIDQVEERLVEITAARLSAKTTPDLLEKVRDLPEMKIRNFYPLEPLSAVLVSSLEKAVELDSDSGRTTNCGNWKRRWIQTVAGQKGMFAERKRNQWWLALADIYKDYRAALHTRGFYDWADMLVEVISQLEHTPEMLADVQERFSYVMIDEFQDTNPAQLRLAHLVADHESANGSPNLMAVGDDDQAIFKFTGAQISNNMLGFKNTYPHAQIIVLTDNYRSSQKVLDIAEKVIEQAEIRVVDSDPSLSKKLAAVNPPPGLGEVKAEIYTSRELQLSETARQIKKHYRPERSIAVLARNHDSLRRMTAILQQIGVPVRYEQQSNVLDHEIVQQTQLIARLMLAIQTGSKTETNTLIHQIIRHPAWGIDALSLWQLAAENFKSPHWLDMLFKSRDLQLKSIGQWFIALAQQAESQPLPVTIEQVLGLRAVGEFTSPLRAYFTKADKNDSATYFHALSALQLLRSLVHEFAAGGNPTLSDFVRFIDVNHTNNRVVADESPFVTGEHAVQLLTVHKAKGLEFDEVYIIDAIEDNWQPRAGNRKPPANLPLQPVGDDLDDFVRLLYVAVTRAKSSVYVCAYSQDHAGKEVAVSPLVLAAFSQARKINEDSKTKLIEVLEENLRWPALTGGQEKEILKARLEEYSLSVTHLLNFLDVTRGGPAHFREKNLLRLPEAKSPSSSFGTAMHAALETAQKQVNKKQLDLEKVIGVFNRALTAEQLPAHQLKRYKTKGRGLINKLFNELGLTLPAGGLPEQKLRDVRLAQAVINGKLDRVDTAQNQLVITDYKTGRPIDLSTKDKSLALKAYKHRLQLVFYALIAGKHPSYDSYRDIECQMVYLEADSANRLVKPYHPSPKEIASLQELIEIVWNKIQKLDLPDTSGYSPDIDGVLAFQNDLMSARI